MIHFPDTTTTTPDPSGALTRSETSPDIDIFRDPDGDAGQERKALEMTESQEIGGRYVCVRVTGYDDKNGRAVVVNVFGNYGDAAEYAYKHPGVVAVCDEGPRRHNVGDEGPFRLGWHPRLDEQVRELQRLEENKREVIVARWDGQNGPPRVGMNATYSLGRDGLNRLEEHVARPFGRVDQPTSEALWVALERYPGVKSEGKIVGVAPDRQGAEEGAARREQELREQRNALEPKALERAEFGQPLHQYRDRHIADQGRQEHGQQPTPSLGQTL